MNPPTPYGSYQNTGGNPQQFRYPPVQPMQSPSAYKAPEDENLFVKYKQDIVCGSIALVSSAGFLISWSILVIVLIIFIPLFRRDLESFDVLFIEKVESSMVIPDDLLIYLVYPLLIFIATQIVTWIFYGLGIFFGKLLKG